MTKCPRTSGEAFKRLDNLLNAEDKTTIRKTHDIDDFHFTLGMWIRNEWLYPGEKDDIESLMRDLGKSSSFNVDVMSSVILDAYQKYLKHQ